MSIWAEVWTRPGDSSFGRVIDELPSTSFGLHKGFNIVGDGNATVPDTFSLFDEILKLDTATPANSASSLVRYFSDESPSTPIFEWIPNLILPSESKDDRTVELTGKEISSILGYARTDAYDWDGTDDWVPKFPDWIWGGRNLLTNPGFEENAVVSTIYELYNDATGGTFTLSDGTDTTSAIAYNSSASNLENEIENDISAITDVRVSGSGTASDPWIIEFITPAFGVTLTCNGAGLTGATVGCVITETTDGELDPRPWTKSQRIGS